MPYVIKVDDKYVARRGRPSAMLGRARVYLRKCDASNSLNHGAARWYKNATSNVKVIEVTLRVKTKKKAKNSTGHPAEESYKPSPSFDLLQTPRFV